MAKFRKTILSSGHYEPPAGSFDATPARMKAWVQRFRKMKQEGMQVPISWGHQPKAKPLDPKDPDKAKAEAEYHKSKYNAGYLDNMDVDSKTGELFIEGDTPALELDEKSGCLVDRDTKTAIKEVSLAVRDWKDGQGRLWPDSIIHVALTPLPVWHGQDGFKSLESKPADGEVHLSLSSLMYTFAAGDDSMADASKDPVAETETPDAPPAETPAEPETPDTGNGVSEMLRTVLGQLESCGIKMPEMTAELSSFKDFLEHLHVALTAYEHAKTQGEGIGGGEGAGAPAAAPAPVTETQTYMSLSTVQDPFTRKLMTNLADQRKQHYKEVIADLMSGMVLNPAQAKRVEEKVLPTYQLSMTADGGEVKQDFEWWLSLLQELNPHPSSVLRIKDASKIKDQKHPEKIAADPERSKQLVDDLCHAGGIPPVKAKVA